LLYSKGVPRISSKNQITLPVDALREAGLKAGDDVVVEVELPDKIVVRRRLVRTFEDAIGIFDGLYPPDYLEKLRAGERY
jgi:bifunctional DNA-binding transcriptional regulator/antitoxin component of YhaV-PrlF toxin-antitoxin module